MRPRRGWLRSKPRARPVLANARLKRTRRPPSSRRWPPNRANGRRTRLCSRPAEELVVNMPSHASVHRRSAAANRIVGLALVIGCLALSWTTVAVAQTAVSGSASLGQLAKLQDEALAVQIG